MIKVKDGYAKLIGTTYQGSAILVLLSNGGNLEFSSATKANTLVLRNASLHIYATYFNSAISDEALTDIGSVYVRNTSDTFIRRISKTQFYSIIDNKFVTLDTALTITGVKTFSTGPILANNAIITLNLNSTSNYTTVVKWLKGGTSQGTYNPSIGQHNTGGDGKGSICILPYPTETSPWEGTVGLFVSKGVLKLDGLDVIHSGNYTSYVLKIGTATVGATNKGIYLNAGTPTAMSASAGSSALPVYMASGAIVACTASSVFSALANSGNNLSITVAGQNRLLVVNYSTYASYLSSWDNRSVNNTPSTYGSSARFEFKANSADGLSNGGSYHGILHFKPYGGTTDFTGGQTHLLGFTDSGNLYMRTSTNSTTWGAWKLLMNEPNANSKYVTALGTSGNYVTWTKNGTTNNLTVPYATKASYVTLTYCRDDSSPSNKGLWNTIKNGTSSPQTNKVNFYTIYASAEGPSTFGEMMEILSYNSNHWLPLLWFGSGKSGNIYYRNKDYNNNTWGAWLTILTNINYSAILDARYVNITGDTMTGALNMNGRLIINPNGYISPTSTYTRRSGMYGVYDSYKTGHIWSMGASYVIPEDGTNFGNLYGLAYKHTNNATGGTMAGGHQTVWCAAGSPKAAMGENGVWAAGGFYKAGSNNNYALLGGGGHRAIGNASGNIPISNGTVNTNLNADMLDGLHSTNFARSFNQWSPSTNVTLTMDEYVTKMHTNLNFTAWGTSSWRHGWWYAGTDSISTPLGTIDLAGAAVYSNSFLNDSTSNYKTMIFHLVGGETYKYTSEETSLKSWVRYWTTGNLNPGNYVTALGTSGNYLTWTRNGTVNNILVPKAYKSDLLEAYTASGFTGGGHYVRAIRSTSGWTTRLYMGYYRDTTLLNTILVAYADNAASATKLNTARTLWGQSFNGTANVSGQLYNAGSFHIGEGGNEINMVSDQAMYLGYRRTSEINLHTGTTGGTTNSITAKFNNSGLYLYKGWFRSTGNTGWYSETYGGGWQMTDTTYIRAYNNKRVYNANAEQYAFYTAGGMTAAKGFWHSAVNSNAYVLLAGGSYKAVSDFAVNNHNHNSLYVTALGTSGNYVTWTKNGTTNNLTVPYAERARQLSSYGQSPNNSHPGYGARIFYSWNIGQANNATAGYSNGITIGSNPGDTAYGFLIVLNMWDDRTYTRRYNSGWQTWKTLAWTSDILNPADYYWANIRISASSSTGTSPTFSTAYTSNWFRSKGLTGWYSETYGGGWHMNDTTYIRAYGSKRVYTANTSLYAFYTSGGMTAAKGFWHSAVNSNSYVLLAGGSYKSLGDFAKGNAGASNRGVYVTGGTVTAMTYYLNATVNSGTSGKLAYYSGANTLTSYTSTVGSSAKPIYLYAGSPSASSYSFTGTYSNPVIVWCGEIYRSSPSSTYWYSVKKGGCCNISFTTNNAASNGSLVISIPNCEPYAAFCSTVRIFSGSTPISAGDGVVDGRSAGMGDYMTLCNVSGTTGSVHIKKFGLRDKNNDSWTNGELKRTKTSDGNRPVARFYLTIVGRYI